MVLSEHPVHLTTRPHLREGNHPAHNSLTMSTMAGKRAGEQGTGKRQTARVRTIRQRKLGTLWSQQQPGRESPRGTSVGLLAGQSAASMAALLCWSSGQPLFPPGPWLSARQCFWPSGSLILGRQRAVLLGPVLGVCLCEEVPVMRFGLCISGRRSEKWGCVCHVKPGGA